MNKKLLILGALGLVVLSSYQNCAPPPDQMIGAESSASTLEGVTENPEIYLNLAPDDLLSLDEGSSKTLKIRLQGPAAQDIPLRVVLTGAASEVRLPATSITLPAGATEADLVINGLSDSDIEAPQNVEVKVQTQDGRRVSNALNLEVIDKTSVPTLTVTDINVQEGTPANLIFRLSRSVNRDIALDIQSYAGTALNSRDFTPVRHDNIVIPRGSRSIRIPIEALSDQAYENSEAFTVKVTNANFPFHSLPEATVWITDTTAPPTLTVDAAEAEEGEPLVFQVELSSAVSFPVDFSYETVDGTAKAGVNFSRTGGTKRIPAGSTTTTITVPGLIDGLFTANKAMTLRLTGITGAQPATVTANGVFVDSTECDERRRIRLSSIFQSDMVLHYSEPRIWGKARPDTEVLVSLKDRPGSSVQVRADAEGDWSVTIPSQNLAIGETEVIVRNQCETKRLARVKIGEVWLCSGQSNMSLPVSRSTSANEVISEVTTAEVKNNLRFFHVARAFSTSSRAEFPAANSQTMTHLWMEPNATNVREMSAVCYHFGRELQRNLNKPVGLIFSAYGGTKIQAWTRAADLPARYRPVDRLGTANETGVLYNQMIAPLGPLKLSGVAWYQGESNRDEAQKYESLTRYWVQSWRRQFLNNVLDFHIVQLAGLGPQEIVSPNTVSDPQVINIADIRQAQLEASLADAHIGMATAIGSTSRAEAESSDIHPKNKKPVGERLARVALAKTYRRADTSAAWLPRLTRVDGQRVIVSFRLPAGVVAPAIGTTISGFQVKGNGGPFTYATSSQVKGFNSTSRIVEVEIFARTIPAPTQVRYLYAGNPLPGYYVPGKRDPLLPICLIKGSASWSVCNFSNQ